MKEAMLYSVKGDSVSCALCSRRCGIKTGQRGFCGVRENIGGKLHSLVWGRPCSYAIDSIEKKPFFHFFPGSSAFSLATVGCNFRCIHCQNWQISQKKQIVGEKRTPEEIIELARGCDGIAYTYTEPTIFMEYALDIAKLAKKKGMYNAFVTNGYMTPEAIKEMDPIDASRIDIKSIRDSFYRKMCSAKVEPVLESIKLLHKKGHIELINLLIPGENDSEEDIRDLSIWVRELDREIPLHFTAYHPANKFSAPPTSLELIEKARHIALGEGLCYVYSGNVPGSEGESTFCPKCNELLIKRYGFTVTDYRLDKEKKCPNCRTLINVVDSI